ncbi:MAG: hypothetical protein R3A80_08500 [Bdellovibrionota bacterium]
MELQSFKSFSLCLRFASKENYSLRTVKSNLSAYIRNIDCRCYTIESLAFIKNLRLANDVSQSAPKLKSEKSHP